MSARPTLALPVRRRVELASRAKTADSSFRSRLVRPWHFHRPRTRRFRDDGGGRGRRAFGGDASARPPGRAGGARSPSRPPEGDRRGYPSRGGGGVRCGREGGVGAGSSSPPRARARRRSASARRAHRAPQDGQCDHARARRARRGAPNPRGGARTFPIPDVRDGMSPTSFTSSRRRAGCETLAWNLRRLRASADTTRLGGASRRETSADDPNPGVPKVPKPTTPRRVPPEQLVCAGHGANPPPTTTATGGCATSLDARTVSAGDAGDGPAKGKRLDRLVKETWRTPTAASAIWRFGRRSTVLPSWLSVPRTSRLCTLLLSYEKVLY